MSWRPREGYSRCSCSGGGSVLKQRCTMRQARESVGDECEKLQLVRAYLDKA